MTLFNHPKQMPLRRLVGLTNARAVLAGSCYGARNFYCVRSLL